MSSPFEVDLANTFKSYISTPATQINLGYTLISFWYTSAFYLGLFLVAIALLILGLRVDYRQGNMSKRPIVILAYVGVGLMLFSLYATVGSFYDITMRINSDIKTRGACSLFSRELPNEVVKRVTGEFTIASKLNDDLARSIAKQRQLYKNTETTSADLQVSETQ